MVDSDFPGASARAPSRGVPSPPSDRASPLITASDHDSEDTPAVHTAQRHAVKFTGSGSEYFRIWTVNLLLIMLTLGVYYPWAKVRKLRYFHNNIEVAGHALDFHADPKRMLRGFLLTAVLLILYSVAGQVSPAAGSIAGLIMMLVWPALVHASLKFRLANTSWRGLHFEFTGNLKQIYRAFALPIVAMIGLGAIGTDMVGPLGDVTPGFQALILIVGFYVLFPYVYYRIKVYQHSHYALATWQTEFRVGFREVLMVFLKTAGISFLTLALGCAAVFLLMRAGWITWPSFSKSSAVQVMIALIPFVVLLIVAFQILPLPYFQSRMQNLAWSRTGNRDLRFKSHLRFGPLLRQTVLNWVLMVLTLGLYWPFAAVAMTRLKLQAVNVHLRKDPDLLVAQARPAYRDNAGDAAADLAGIDFGL